MREEKRKTKKSAKWQPRSRRVFSEAFKREKVAQITSGQISVRQLSELWQVSTKSVYQWIYRYSPQHQRGTIMVVQKESEATKLAVLQKRIAELEQALGQKQMVIDYQDKLLEAISEEIGVDVKKNTKVKC